MEPISSSTLAKVALSALRTGAGQVSRRRAARTTAEAERLAEMVLADTDARVVPILAAIKSIASESDQTKIGTLLHTAEFHEHSRAVSIAVITGELERTGEDLTRNLSALLVMSARIDPGRSSVYATALNRVLIAQNEAGFNRIRRLDRRQAERVVDRASMERMAGYLRSLSARTSLLDRLDPAAIKAALDFSVKYRSTLHARTASITPAHFDIQRHVPIDKLYVTPSLRPDGPDQRPSKLSLPQVVRRAYRTVVLGPPGAGKSTLAQKIAYELSADQWKPDASPVPFIVILRKYEERKVDRHYSVVDYIEAHA
jgi:NACHT domain